MNKNNLKYPCLIAALYFGVNMQAQTQDSTTREQKIEEVVMIGYGTAKKRDLTGSITKVAGKDVNDKPASNPVNSLQGKVAGLSIVNSGQPGSQADVRIRGTVTINATQPLYVVDGVFADNIDFLNPADVESMEVLKDASSLAIFGSRGANGVIIVTTKRGVRGRTSINFTSSIGVKSFDNRPDLVNGDQFRTLYNEDRAFQGVAPYDFSLFGANTDWVDVISKKGGFIQQHNVTVSNGSEKNRMSFSFGYQSEDGSIKYQKYDRMTFKFNDDLSLSDKLKIGFGITGSYAHLPQDRGFGSALNATPVVQPKVTEHIMTVDAEPIDAYGLYNSLPQEIGAAQIGNPLAVVEGMRNTFINREWQFNPNAYLEFNFWDHFTFRSNYFVTYKDAKGRSYTPIFDVYVPETNTTSPYSGNLLTGVSTSTFKDVKFQQNQLLTYKNDFGEHDITAMLGFETVNREVRSFGGSARGSLTNPLGQIPNNPRFWYLNSKFVDTKTITASEGGYDARQSSYFGRVLYNYSNKYYVNGSLRYDGSSWLAPGNRYDWFWAVGAAWEISKENFMQDNKIFDYLKLKGSYGDLGNQYIDPDNLRFYGYPNYVEGGTGVFNGNVYPAFQKAFEEATDLTWEHIKTYEVGFESMSLNRKLSFETAYYNRRTEGLLWGFTGGSGTQFFENSGSFEAQGFEFTAGWKDHLTENLSYYINGNLTTTKTKMIEVPAERIGLTIVKEGLPVGSFYGYVVEGVYQTNTDIANSPTVAIGSGAVAPGDLKFKDVNGDGKITTDDRTVIGNPTPDFTYGFSVGFDFKGFYLNSDFYGVYGNEVFRSWGNGNSFAPFNYREERLDRWTGQGTSNWEPRSYSASAYNRENSTYMIEDGSFFRIRNVQLGYNFSKDFISSFKLQALQLYFNVQNLKTWDHVNGFTPEAGGSATQFGVNSSGYPNPRIVTFGLNATF